MASRPAYLFLILVLGLHLSLGSVLQVANPAFGIAFDELFLFAGFTLLLTRGQNFHPAPFLGLRLPPARTLFAAFGAGVAGFFVAGGVNAINRWIVGPEIADRYDITSLFQTRSPAEGALLVFGVSVLAPLGEELLFRGYLLRVLGTRYGTLRGVLVTSFLFAVIHFNPASLLALFVLGLVFALLRVWSGSIWPSILGHAIQNGTSSALVLAGVAEESPDELPIASALFLLAFSLPFLLLALRLVRQGPAASNEDADLPVDPEGDHRFRVSRVKRQLAALVLAMVVALGLFAAIDGETALLRLQRASGRSPEPPPLPTGEGS